MLCAALDYWDECTFIKKWRKQRID